MTSTVIAFLLLCIPVIYQLHANVRAKIRNYVTDKGGEFIELKRQTNMLGRATGIMELIYRDRQKKIRCCLISSDIFGVRFGEDRVLTDEISVFNYTREPEAERVYSSDVKEVRKFNTPFGEVSVELTSADIEVGNRVFLGTMFAPNGKYKLGFMHHIYVKNGRVA